MNYYDEIKNKLIDVEIQTLVKDYSKNKYTLEKYYEIGKLLIEAQGKEKRAKYGESLIKEYSKRLTNELGKKYNYRYLFDVRRLYLFLKVHPLGAQLSFSHYRLLFPLINDDEIVYY